MDKLIHDFSIKALKDFFKKAISSFKSEIEDISHYIEGKAYHNFSELTRVGNVEFKDSDELIVFTCKYNGVLSERSSKKQQFEIAKLVLKEDFKDGAIFVFHDESGKFRFSFIRRNWDRKADKKYSTWKRFTYFVNPENTNKTFRQSIEKCTFKNLDSIQKAFSVEELTKDFYNNLFKWYQWTLTPEVGITFPNDTAISEDDRVKLEEQMIRLITRLLFVWFIKQKHLVPEELFKIDKLKSSLKNFDPSSRSDGNYYNAILQNLFFATLNKAVIEREFAKLVDKRDIKTRYRYLEMFAISEEDVLELFRPIPFLNGGLFECLDKEVSTHGIKYHLDGFSRSDKRFSNGSLKHRAFIPNCVFFDEEKGLIPLLERYNFTVEENVPNEIQVALDPELLGNVFENLLGAFNSETQESARKQSGSFYTPKEIVTYMVDESLIAYLKNTLPDLDEKLIHQVFEQEILPDSLATDHILCEKIANQLRSVKILDPACGSGAFPMGILNRMVEVLDKLDAKNRILHHDLKLHLIEECIYGVDIQTIAAQISKLRFFISLIVEQEVMDLSKPDDNYGVLTLPNLETKFVAANTLIGLESENNGLLDLTDPQLKTLQKKLLDTRQKHFYARSTSDKIKLRKQDEQLRNEIIKYLSENSVKPNEEKISNNLQRIEKLLIQRKAYEVENWVENFQKEVQTSMFSDQATQQIAMFKVDLNEKPRAEIDRIIKALQLEISKERSKLKKVGFEDTIEKIAKWNPYDQNTSSPFFDTEWIFGLEEGFDIVIGNPPYISTKGIGIEFKKLLVSQYGFADDTYNHFFFKGTDLLKRGGILSYITPKTFWTTQTKRNLRDLILSHTIKYVFDTANPFEAAMVDTCITSFSKSSTKENTLKFLDGSKDLKSPITYFINQSTYIETQNSVIFKPTEYNLNVYNLYGKKVKELYEKWWDKISTSKNISKNEKELQAYRESLKPGDLTLLGLITEGGVGLQTGNNGKYIGIRKSTKWAKNIIDSRPKKLAEAIKVKKIKIDALDKFANINDYLNSLSEAAIVELFDSMKENYGRDIFGQGYIYRLVEDNEIADIEQLTEDEKLYGIDQGKKFYVPYDKGDKDGNRWYLETPFAIAWTKENVGFLKANSGKKGNGMPVVRNPQYYFKEGFCWTNILNPQARLLKTKLKHKSVNDVGSMSLSSITNKTPNYFIITLLNSELLFDYYREFINVTVNIQINDIRQLPIIIPNENELKKCKILFDKIKLLKKQELLDFSIKSEYEPGILDLESQLNNFVNTLY